MVYDIIIIAVLLAAAISGAVSGLVRQLGTLVAFVVAILACRLLGPSTVAFCGAQSSIAVAACYVALFIAAFVVVMLIARLLHATINALKLGPVNRVLGALFRMALWTVLLSACFNLFFTVAPSREASYLQPGKPWRAWVLGAAPYVVGYIGEASNP